MRSTRWVGQRSQSPKMGVAPKSPHGARIWAKVGSRSRRRKARKKRGEHVVNISPCQMSPGPRLADARIQQRALATCPQPHALARNKYRKSGFSNSHYFGPEGAVLFRQIPFLAPKLHIGGESGITVLPQAPPLGNPRDTNTANLLGSCGKAHNNGTKPRVAFGSRHATSPNDIGKSTEPSLLSLHMWFIP